PSTSSTALRQHNRSYIHSIEFAQPTPAISAAQLTALNPHLPTILPHFAKLMETAKVSTRFAELYARKLQILKMGELLTPHNYFDCETALLLEHPDTGRKVFLLQADMDVVTDGSDPGRAPNLADYDLARSSDWFLPETAYSWHNSGRTENPFLTYYPETLAKLQELRTQLEANAKTDPGVVWREMIKSCDDQIYRVRERGLHNSTKSNLRNRRFLLADRDPFVVLPVPWVNKDAAFSPRIGDYAAVIHGNKIYPAILGDAGPSDKVGEASLRLARELNPKANGRTRAISDLTVTYLFFPKSATKAQTPDLTLWHQKVSSLLNEIGGLGEGFTLHAWNVSPSP
ncbi:MAG: glycoside hydrolase family 75 protein, partial [Verrucomicrobia bacterium]|nr:glycoside hydrolase family 75 protein [Verrucomicrobiota bacterium]